MPLSFGFGLTRSHLLAVVISSARRLHLCWRLCHAAQVAGLSMPLGRRRQCLHSLAAHLLQVSSHSSLLGRVNPAGDMGMGMRPMGMDMMGLSQALGMFGGIPPGKRP